jgi:hypothetical protein
LIATSIKETVAMASQEETMRLVAELLDKTSGPLKDIQKSLRDTATVAKKMQGEGTAGTKEHEKSYHKLHSSIEKTRHELSESFTPAMAALGLTTFGAGEAIGKVIEKLKSFGEQYTVMRDATRRTGASADFLEATANAIERLTGEDPAQAIQNLANMREQMDRLSRQRPDTINAWKTAYTGLYESLGKQLVGKTLPQQIEETFAWFDAHPDVAIDKKRDILALMGLDPRLATARLKEVQAAIEAGKEYQKAHPFESDIAEKLHDSFIDLKEAIAGAGWEINHSFGEQGAASIKSLAATVKDASIAFKELMIIGSWKPFAGESLDVLKKRLLDAQGGTPAQDWDLPRLMTPEEIKKEQQGEPLPPAQTKPNAYGAMTPAQKLAAGMQPVSFNSGGGGGGPEQILTLSVKEGMLAAFREWFSSVQSGGGSGGDGFQKASFTPSGSKIDNTPIGQQIRQQLEGETPGPTGEASKGGGHRALAKALRMDKGSGDDGNGNTPGNSRGERNNNRGNMKFGPLARAFGATHADDKGFAVFPDQKTGDAAQDALLKSNAYSGLTLDQFGNKYSEGNPDWKKTVGAALGIGPHDIVNNNDPRLPGAIRTAEGTAGKTQFSADARHMDPMAPRGASIVRDGLATIKAKISGKAFKVAAWAAPNFQHFIDSYESHGGVLGPNTGTLGERPGNKSYHPLARAIDVNQIGRGIRGGGRTLDRATEDQIADDAGLYPGSRFGDIGHFEARNRAYALEKQKQWLNPQDQALTGAHLRDMLHHAKTAGVNGGGGAQTIKGDASLDINLNGFPKGTKTDVTYGGLFTQYTLAKGQQMEAAKSE